MAKVAPRILLVDDDLRIRALLERYLSDQGFSVVSASDGVTMDKVMKGMQVDLVVLDLALPDEDGLSICRRLRQNDRDLPIIMLTAKGDEVDRIIGLELGADDYVPKPFNPRELVARISAVLRRRPKTPVIGRAIEGDHIIKFGKFELNLGTRTLTKEGEQVPLTTGEFTVLQVLATHAGQPLSRDRLLELARGKRHDAYERSIDIQISRLRRLIEDDPSNPRHLQTVWGFGYVFIAKS